MPQEMCDRGLMQDHWMSSRVFVFPYLRVLTGTVVLHAERERLHLRPGSGRRTPRVVG